MPFLKNYVFGRFEKRNLIELVVRIKMPQISRQMDPCIPFLKPFCILLGGWCRILSFHRHSLLSFSFCAEVEHISSRHGKVWPCSVVSKWSCVWFMCVWNHQETFHWCRGVPISRKRKVNY